MKSTHVGCALLAACLLVLGCSDKAVAPPCDLWTASAVISGRVTDASGAAIADAIVEVQVASAGSCDGAEDWGHFDRVTTDAGGHYSAQVALGNSRGVRCVRATEMQSGTSVRDEVEFIGGCEETRPPGQLNVDLVIP
jgi:hypothetical protein